MSTHHSSSSSSSTAIIVDRLLTRSFPSTREDYFIQQKSKTAAAAASAVDNNNSDSTSFSSSSENCSNSSQNKHSTTTIDNSLPSLSLSKKKCSSKSQLESLSTDITSHILSYLHPSELYNISLISRCGYGMFHCDALWRCNFSIRWNCFPDFDILDHHDDNNGGASAATGSESNNSSSSSSSSNSSNNNGFWKKCFINAYTNPHDLWVRHWNCVYPEDVTIVSGRTVIPTEGLRLQQQRLQQQQQQQRKRLQQLGLQKGTTMKRQEQTNNEEEELNKFQKEFDSPMLRYCPTCRYYPTAATTAKSNNNIGYYSNDVVNEAVDAELCYTSQLKWQRQQQQQDDPIETAEIVASAHALLNNSPGQYSTLHGCSSISKTIYYATQYSIAKWCRHLRMIVDNHDNDDEDDEEDDGGGKDEFTTKTCSSLLDRFNNGIISSKRVNTEDIQSPPPQSNATFAFQCASTYNRTIRTNQYQSSGIQFLSDAVFFNVHSSTKSGSSIATKRDQKKLMMDELRHDLNSDSSSVRELGSDFETSHHTWHIIRLTNPDFIRPITFRAYIQCPDAFTVYPSEGYVRPGETVYVTLGVTMKGCMMNEAFERLDVEREEVDPELARVYATEGHLPFVPFAIRYMFAPPIPLMPSDYQPRPSHGGGNHAAFGGGVGVGPATRAQQSMNQESVLDHLWENIKSEADVRTIYISAHINNNYEFEEFQHATLSPFHVTTRTTEQQADLPLTANMPQILHKSPELFSIIQNLKTETEQSASGDAYRTEKKCVLCKRDWGPQSELLGRAYLLRRLECQKHVLLREQECADFERTIRMIPTLLRRVLLSGNVDEDDVVVEEDSDSSSSRMLGLNRISKLLYCIHREHILPMKGKRLVSREERQWYLECEIYIDETYADIQKILVESLPEEMRIDQRQQWKRRGVYPTSKCTELVGAPQTEPNTSLTYKSEPKYLLKLTSLDYNPFGMANLGMQEDPNHHDSAVSMHTDMFKNDALKSWVIAQLMMGNPKVLIGHGVYDRVRKPGSIIRCPSFPVDAYFPLNNRPLERLDQIRKVIKKLDKWASIAARFEWKPKKSLGSLQQMHFGFKSFNFEFNEQDPDGLDLIVFGQQRFQINFQTSMAHYISNVPLPGQGKLLLLSSPQSKDDDNFSISTDVLYTKVQPYENLLYPSMGDEENQEEADEEESQLQQSAVRDRNNQQNDQEVLAMNLIMLIATHMGWTIDDDYRGGFLLVDRRLLIACQWFSNTIMTASLLASLLSRKILLINPFPVDGVMQVGWFGSGGVPSKTFPVHTTTNLPRTSQRFLSPDECGVAALIVVIFYFCIGRLSERHISRSYERELVESATAASKQRKLPVGRLVVFFDRLWDASVPYFIQRRTYISARNSISYENMMKQVVHQRSMNLREQRIFDAKRIGVRNQVASETLGAGSYLIGFCCFVLSFMACSPHFSVNSLTTFFCSVAYGMSLTIESMAIIRRTTSSGVLSLAKPRRLNTLVIGFILIGQLVGSSGGILFLAEFIVTTISLLLGGAATVTTRAIESWITFLCLSSTSLWGFLSARLGLLDGMRKKRRGFPSNILCASLCSGVAMWITVLADGGWNDVSPGEVLVVLLRDHSRQLLSSLRQWYYNR